jgi:2-amino-4-hydroxy-6-hydroxymethyldihydropteridine diphosphokinase
MPRIGIALGSNLGNRLANLQAAKEALKKIASIGEMFLCAPVYQTEPLLCPPGSPVFYNTVIEISFEGDAFELLAKTQALEKELGRVGNAVRNAPRVIDIDLLYYGDEVVDTEELVLPHPRISERRFVLQPLADICGERVLPGSMLSIRERLSVLESLEAPLVQVQS